MAIENVDQVAKIPSSKPKDLAPYGDPEQNSQPVYFI